MAFPGKAHVRIREGNQLAIFLLGKRGAVVIIGMTRKSEEDTAIFGNCNPREIRG